MNCDYTKKRIYKPVFYTVPLGNSLIDAGENKAEITGDVTPFRARSVILNEESNFDNSRFAFNKSLSVVFDGYFPQLKDFSGCIIVEGHDGSKWLVNVDFVPTLGYVYNIDGSDERTNYTFHFSSNFATTIVNDEGIAFPSPEPACGYALLGSEKLFLAERRNAGVDKDLKPVLNGAMTEVNCNSGSVSATETYSGGTYTSSVSFTLTFGEYSNMFHYNLLRFVQNKFSAKISKHGGNPLYIGWRGDGLFPKFSIATAESVEEDDLITITLTQKGHLPLISTEGEAESGQTSFWRYVTGASGVDTMVCVGDGTAIYTLKAEYDSNMNPTGRYSQKEGYDWTSRIAGIIPQGWDDYQTVQWDACHVGGACDWTENNLPSTIEFDYAYQQKTFNLMMDCDFSIADWPSWVQFSQTSFSANIPYDFTITATTYEQGAMTGELTIVDSSGAKRHTSTLVWNPLNIINDKVRSVNALSRTFVFTLNVDVHQLQVYGQSGVFDWQLYDNPNSIVITIPANTGSTDVTYSLSLLNNVIGVTDTLYIHQSRTYTQEEFMGYVCEGGDKYAQYQVYKAWCADCQYVNSGMRTELVETGSTYCDTVQFKSEPGHYICIGNVPHEASHVFRSDDGGATWTPTGEVEIGAPLDNPQGGCTVSGEQWVLTNQKQCSSN